MQFYMAPMEGLTGYVYRNAYQKHFHNIDKYFTPFLMNKKLSYKERNDILPEHNAGMNVIPQILTNRAEDFLMISDALKQYGYDTVNLNLGCPSGTVVAKNKGSGFLAFPEDLDRFLENIFAECPLNISVKTRIGREDSKGWEQLLLIYEKYPIDELIIHPRVQKDFYKNTPDLEAFSKALMQSHHSICYNGDIAAKEDFVAKADVFPQVEKIMIGRGILKNPGLISEIRSQETIDKPTLWSFHEDILNGYLRIMPGDKNTLFKMKELWSYMGQCFTAPERYMKKIKKSERIADYNAAVLTLFQEQEIQTFHKKVK